MEALFAAFLLAVPAGWAAPKDSMHRPVPPPSPLGPGEQGILNPLHPGEESLRLLQDYLRDAGLVDQDVTTMTREQALLLLFALHDYDKSGQLDGLEFMSLLSELSSQQAQGQSVPELVVLTVDAILEAQDWNRDGLLAPSELLLLHPRELQPPPVFDGPGEKDGTEQWPPAEPAGMDSVLPGALSHNGPAADPPKAFEAAKEQEGVEGASLLPPTDLDEAGDVVDVPADAQQGEPEEEITMKLLSDEV